MRSTAPLLVTSLLAAISACATSQAPPGTARTETLEAPFADGQKQISARAAEIAWGKCPPMLPAGCEMAVLEGDPKREILFTARFRINGGFELRPHWHPRNERVTILEGTVGVGFGDEIDRDKTTWFGPGDFYVNRQEAHHYVLADGPVVLQITGVGPWETKFLEGAHESQGN